MRISDAHVAELRERSWRLPFRARLHALESHQSFFARLVRANYCEYVHLDHRARLAGMAYPDQASRKSELAVELMSGLPVGTFSGSTHALPQACTDRGCRCSASVVGPRHLCLQCARGESVGLVDNFEPYVCIRHQRWTGPGAGIDGQLSVRGFPEFGRAASKHRRLLRDGLLDPLRFRAIWKLLTDEFLAGRFLPRTGGIVADWRFRTESHMRAVVYPDAISLYSAFETGHVLERVLDPRNDLQAVEDVLAEIVEVRTGTVCAPDVAQRLRYHLRPDFYRVALATTPGWHDGPSTVYPPPKMFPHDRDLSAIDFSRWPTTRKGIAPGYPGFDRPDSPMYIVSRAMKEFRDEFRYDVRGDLFDEIRRSNTIKSFWVCRAGHAFEASIVSRERTPRSGCQACAKKITVPGVTDIATTDPEAFSYWDHCANLLRGLRYWEVTAKREEKAVWTCRRGHSFEMFIMLFTADPRCRRCYPPNQARVDLVLDHPDLLPLWDADANDAFDLRSLALNVDDVAWRCQKEDHSFTSTVYDMLHRRQLCPICSGRRIVSGINDFQTLYPEEAEEFSWALNDGVTPDQLSPGNQRDVFLWVCRKQGHIYPSTVHQRVLGFGCGHCAGRRVTPGETDLESARPGVAARWHSVANGFLTPRDMHSGSTARAYFTCLCDRPYRCVIRDMRVDKYCQSCTAKISSWKRRTGFTLPQPSTGR